MITATKKETNDPIDMGEVKPDSPRHDHEQLPGGENGSLTFIQIEFGEKRLGTACRHIHRDEKRSHAYSTPEHSAQILVTHCVIFN